MQLPIKLSTEEHQKLLTTEYQKRLVENNILDPKDHNIRQDDITKWPLSIWDTYLSTFFVCVSLIPTTSQNTRIWKRIAILTVDLLTPYSIILWIRRIIWSFYFAPLLARWIFTTLKSSGSASKALAEFARRGAHVWLEPVPAATISSPPYIRLSMPTGKDT